MQDIKKAKDNCDFLIVLYHGGKEFYRYPSPRLQKVCRAIVENGANLVLCQHSHCIGAKEIYHASTILYGQGNFIFDRASDEYWNSGLLVEITDSLEILFHPFIKEKTGRVSLARRRQKTDILAAFNERSEAIQKPGFLEKQYIDFSKKYIGSYLLALHGHRSLLFRVFNKLTRGIIGRLVVTYYYRRDCLLPIENFIECEAHRELLLSGLKQKR